MQSISGTGANRLAERRVDASACVDALPGRATTASLVTINDVPLVLTQNTETADGHDYADVLGQRYEFPSRYLKHMVSGELFVYYRGRRGAPEGERPYAYIGAGVIGTITGPADGRDNGLIVTSAVPVGL